MPIAIHPGIGQISAEPSHLEATPPKDDTAYLAALGARVRRIRGIRGMSRKVLAATAGISERYIAQLEGGTGNVSINLLRRIAQATGVQLEDLVAEIPEDWRLIRNLLPAASSDAIEKVRALLQSQSDQAKQSQSARPRTALIGLRGAGKTSLGRIAAKSLGIDFIELNQEIETDHGLSVTEIFKLYGQEGYRRLEFETLKRIVASNAPMILATGGGIVAEAQTFELLLSSFYTVWIRAEPGDHMARVREQGDLRPMANDRAAMKELVTILTSREPLYARADGQLSTSGRPIEDCSNELAGLVRTRFPAELPAG